MAVLGERLHTFDQVAQDFMELLKHPDRLDSAIGGTWIAQCNQVHESVEWRNVQAAVQLEGPAGIARALEECRAAQASYHFRLIGCIAARTGATLSYEIEGDMSNSSIYRYLESARKKSDGALEEFMRIANSAMYGA
ncbi:hypothetical protein [Streptomyces adustus]